MGNWEIPTLRWLSRKNQLRHEAKFLSSFHCNPDSLTLPSPPPSSSKCSSRYVSAPWGLLAWADVCGRTLGLIQGLDLRGEVQFKGVGGFISSAKYCLSECLHEQKDSELPSLSLADQSPCATPPQLSQPRWGNFPPLGLSRINEAAAQRGGRGPGSELIESSLQFPLPLTHSFNSASIFPCPQ